jgi:heptosyltransferase-2
LVIRGGALGDFILTLPVLSALRGNFPKSRIEILGHPQFGSLAVAGGLADKVHSLESSALAGLFVPDGTSTAEAKGLFSQFGTIVSYLYDPEKVFEKNVIRCFGGQFIAGQHRPDENLSVHATAVLLRALEALGIYDGDPQPRLELRSLSGAKFDPGSIRTPCLALHPGSGSARKNWPQSKWSMLLKELGEWTGWKFLLIGGEAESERVSRLARCLPTDRTAVGQNLPLIELAGRMSICAGFVGHDSGITHLAAALGLAGVVLWGETKQEIWRPLSEKMDVLCSPCGLQRLAVGEVIEKLSITLKYR